MTYTTPDADARRSTIDAVIFDMDGVLLDISGSIRVVNCLSVPYYLRTVLGWPAPDDLLTSDDIEMFKNAGGFNDDWDLTYALVLHYLWKGHEFPDASPETLNTLQPSLARYASRIRDRGGWLRAAEEIVFEKLSKEDRLAVETHYRKPVIRQCFQELYAGEYSERLYGFAPTLYHGRGYANDDRLLLDLAKLPEGKMIGVQTGRTLEEARIGLERCGLAHRIPETQVVTKSDGFQKPQPGGLAKLAERMGFTNALYIGDALDDLRTVKNFNQSHGAAPSPATFLSAQVLTGPAGKANEKLFRTSGADILAADVNEVLDWLG